MFLREKVVARGYMAGANSIGERDMITDSGCSMHMTPHRHWFREISKTCITLHKADGASSVPGYIGYLRSNNLGISKALWHHGLTASLFSVG